MTGGLMRGLLVLAVLISMTGCGSKRKSSLLLERTARGTLAETSLAARAAVWHLEPTTAQQIQEGVSVAVTHASPAYLQAFFSNPKAFREFAGKNPYFSEHLVFYLKIANSSPERIFITPGEFVLVDDRGSQYGPLNVDYVTAFAEYRAPMSSVTRGLLEEAEPGYFGFSVPVGKIFFGSKPVDRFALVQQSALQMGFLYPGVIHDGLIAFWSPNQEAKALRLFVSSIKTDFTPEGKPRKSLEFIFPFTTTDGTTTSPTTP